jgi:2-haloacid dehalogenase
MHDGRASSSIVARAVAHYGRIMRRRTFLGATGALALASACDHTSPRGPRSPLTGPSPIRAVAFDLFTVFDPRGPDRRVAELLDGHASLAATWKTRLFEYSWLRAASGQYVDFARLVRDALTYAARAHGVVLEDDVRARLEASLVELDPWPDARAVLERLRAAGLHLAPLANFAPSMIDALLAHAGFDDLFDARISTDEARTYKPDPRAYALAETTFGLSREEIAFAAFGGWDAAGASWYGYPTFWVNRLDASPEELAVVEASGPDLVTLAEWIAHRRTG